MTSNAALLSELSKIVGEANLLHEEADTAGYLRDWRGLYEGRALCVLRPGSTEEVANVVRACHSAGVAIVPQGGNTGLAGGAVPDESGTQVLLSLARMTRIRQLDPVAQYVEAEAGAILANVQQAAKDQNRLLPVSLGAEGSATIGGIVSTNAGGTNVLRYGMTRELVLGLEVVLGDGQILNVNRSLRKDNAGFDLKQLFIGSEGSFGIVTSAVLRLSPLPTTRETILLAVEDVPAALSIFASMQELLGETISAFELISDTSMQLVLAPGDKAAPVGRAPWYVLVECATSLPGLRHLLETAVERLFEEGHAQDGVIAESLTQAETIWGLRETVAEAEAHAGRPIKHDVSISPTRFPQFLADCKEVLTQVAPGAQFSVFGHLGDGNLHCNVLASDPAADPAPVYRAMHDLVLSHGGSISAEHGLGRYRVAEWQRLTDHVAQELALTVKHALDPAGLLNPGKVFPIVEAK